ncbi:MAG: transglutaminase domain-containing protein [Solobacterium sp.]|nr:transglutaminase domain-containing protein [Solobacterium sp.]
MNGNKKPGKFRRFIIHLLMVSVCLGCGSAKESTVHAAQEKAVESSVAEEEKVEPAVADSVEEELTEPIVAEAEEKEEPEGITVPFETAEFHKDQATGSSDVLIDLSCTDQGYVALSVIADARLKFQVMKDDMTYNYDIASDGTPSVFPLQSGDGHYRFRVMKNIVDKKYAELYSVEADVVLKDEFQPFIRPSNYASYTQNSKCIKKAAQMAAKAKTKMDIVKSVYEFICKTVTYDTEKAMNVKSGYMPVPDETMTTGKGICFDYASLAASMLRSQGIPTKLIFGYVSPSDVYHAWNMIYTEETGWITVEFKVSGKEWNRIDLTFSANGADSDFIGDGENYTDVYQY